MFGSRYLLGLPLILVLLGGCDKLKKLDKMGDTTQGMSKTTKDMKILTDNLYGDNREGLSAKLRQDSYIGAMNLTPDMELKRTYATVYLMAFEFQVWTGTGDDTVELRERLYNIGVEEFFRLIKDLIHKSETAGRWEPIYPGTDDNQDRNLVAISAALHRVDKKQEIAEAQGRFKAVSMLDLIKSGLSLAETRDYDASAVLKDYQNQVLNYEAEAIYLLQLRINALLGGVLKNLTIDSEKSYASLIPVVGLGQTWDVNVTRMNRGKMITMQEYLNMVIEDKEFLTSIGVKPELNSRVQTTLSHINSFVDKRGKGKSIGEREVRLQELRNLRDLINTAVEGKPNPKVQVVLE